MASQGGAVVFILAQFSFMKQVHPNPPEFPHGEEVGQFIATKGHHAGSEHN